MVGSWQAFALSYITALLALTSTDGNTMRSGGAFSWLLTRSFVVELGAMSFCFNAFHFVPFPYARAIGLPATQSAAVEFCAVVGKA